MCRGAHFLPAGNDNRGGANREKRGRSSTFVRKTLLHFLCLVSFSLAVTGCFMESEEVRTVKDGHFSDHPEKTVGEAIDSFFANPRWESGIGVDGETKGKTLVNVKGRITYMEKEVTAGLQFIVDPEKGSFQLHAMEMNDVPQNYFLMAALVEKMFERNETPISGQAEGKSNTAASGSDSPDAEDTDDDLETLQADFETADREINRLYREIRSNLSPGERESLKREQIVWIKKKESTCNDMVEEKDKLSCWTDTTRERIDELKAYVR